jgi:eukaryotic-like serine/threonine-protein kinase
VNAVTTPHLDLTGAILSRRYALKRVIGSGGMGTVYESIHPDEQKPVAVKVLASDYMQDADVRSRFVEEGRMCQRLIHPNIVRVFEVSEAEDGSPYIVMEFLDGVPLSAYTRTGGRVPVVQAATILQGILAGLAAAHAQGIVHRDLKPENVFLAREPNGQFCAKILDFGIAKVMDLAGGMGSKTRTGIMLGTPAYMSPEQIKNTKDTDVRTDLWSAAVMFFEMLTGRVAFPAPTEYARLAAVLNTDPPPLESIDPALAPLSALVQKGMSKDRTQRYQTALEMARALGAAMGENVAAIPLSRLPDVPSLYAPLPPPAGSHQGAATIVQQAAPETPMMVTGPPTSTGPSGTLASRHGASVSEPPPQIVIVPNGGTLPSENLPMLAAAGARRGVPLAIVIVLVVGALAAGFLLGFAVARVV